MIPIHQKKLRGAAAAPLTTHYVVARNGLFLCKRMLWVEATVPVVEAVKLEVQQPSAKLLLPTLPAEIMAKALKLARVVCDISRSEVCLLLHYSEKTGYQLSVPAQRVDLYAVDYDASERLPDMLCVGTIHSHGRLHAFHSMTDHADEETADGVHITLGNVDLCPQFSLSAELAINGTRFPVDVAWFEGLVPERGQMYRSNWPGTDSWKVPKKWSAAIQHPKGIL